MSRKPILMSLPSPSPSTMTSACSSSGEMDEMPVRRGKKRRLDHLTWEEKVQRKKLKNRVAAQTSRDRKKMKMDEMESNIAELVEENGVLRKNFRTLETENRTLRQQNDTLQRQMEELRQRLDEQEERLTAQNTERDLQQRVKEEEEEKLKVKTTGVSASATDIALKSGSAASTDVDPLQKGLSAANQAMAPKSSPSTTSSSTTTSSVWQVIALCLLYKICSKQPIVETTQDSSRPATVAAAAAAETIRSSTCAPGKSWPKLYSQISPDKLQAMLREAATKLPRMQAPHHHCLDSWWGPEQSAWNPAKVEA